MIITPTGQTDLIVDDDRDIDLITDEDLSATMHISSAEDPVFDQGTYNPIYIEGTGDYDQLEHKPLVNGVQLTGDKSSHELGLASQADLNDAIANIDYNTLINKPQIEAVTLIGNKTFDELGLGALSNTELENMLT